MKNQFRLGMVLRIALVTLAIVDVIVAWVVLR